MHEAQKNQIPWFIWLIFISLIIFGHVVILTNKPIGVRSEYPPKDPGREVLYYNLTLSRWIYKDEIKPNLPENVNRRANDRITDKELEEAIQKHLERKIKGYRKATYWGEEEVDIEDLD